MSKRFDKPVRRLVAALVIAAIGTGSAHACRTRKPGMDASPEMLVASAREVYVAKVVRAAESESGQVVYDFTVLQHLAGPYRGRFEITARSAVADDVAASPDHSDERFWQAGGGRLGGLSNWCYVTPRFDVGMTYLVFLDRPETYRSFERINVIPGREPISHDKWYQYVAQQLHAVPKGQE
ncbi:hypothetical protein LQ564_19525 [Massilia sp. G4R7]|uniref:Uncharacterized protein n=1 Tax=Massilia phyllostachyos TaxID=2898585 RepID=A0ABS8QBS8_9BURK|nr:hypothetical protein [Massilia phyllostachyos]MCD2518497.1 hypothetical protein [Massilia phyllostachyos]